MAAGMVSWMLAGAEVSAKSRENLIGRDQTHWWLWRDSMTPRASWLISRTIRREGHVRQAVTSLGIHDELPRDPATISEMVHNGEVLGPFACPEL